MSCKQDHSYTLQLVKKTFCKLSPHVTICRRAATNCVTWKMASAHNHLSLLQGFPKFRFCSYIYPPINILTPAKNQVLLSSWMQALRKFYYNMQFISFMGPSLLLVAFGSQYLAEATAKAKYQSHFWSPTLHGAECPECPFPVNYEHWISFPPPPFS